jgi:hypothetical protein
MCAMAVPRSVREEEELKPYQVELLKLQRYLEDENRRMIVLFEGRDAAGKGGTIRRVTRYMNEKHYRVVALGKPTEEQRTQWYFQRYVAQFPSGGEIVLFDRSWYNRAMVEPVFGFCTDEEYRNFLKGVVGFEKDLVRQGTILVKLYFSVTKEEQARRVPSGAATTRCGSGSSARSTSRPRNTGTTSPRPSTTCCAAPAPPTPLDHRAPRGQAQGPAQRDPRDAQRGALPGPRR